MMVVGDSAGLLEKHTLKQFHRRTVDSRSSHSITHVAGERDFATVAGNESSIPGIHITDSTSF